jgi:hypothetical protein
MIFKTKIDKNSNIFVRATHIYERLRINCKISTECMFPNKVNTNYNNNAAIAILQL